MKLRDRPLGQMRFVCVSCVALIALIGGAMRAVGHVTNARTHFLQQGPKLVGAGAVGVALQGRSVALSGDGNTAFVGGLLDNSEAGAAWAWTRSGNVWTQQGPKLVGTGTVGSARQGNSVSLSADGNTALVGGYSDNGQIGAAWVWTRSVGVWTQQGPKLVGTGAVGSSLQGISVSLSADGNTAIVGGGSDNGGVGAAWIWTRSGGIWTQQGPKLVGSGAVGLAQQGVGVCLSADGNTALVGGPYDNHVGGTVGAAWVWTRIAGVWTQQGPKLVGLGAVDLQYQGAAVSLSADGNTGLIGGPGHIENGAENGAAWVWTRSNGVWTQQGPKLVGWGVVWRAAQGESVSLSADGNIAIVGGSEDNSQTGAAWIWRRTNDVWIQQGSKLVGSGAVGHAIFQGVAVSLSADGNTAIVGGFYDNTGVGAAWVFGSADLPPAPADFDGDGKTDRTVFRPSTGFWYSALSGGNATATGWGLPDDIDVPADYDGDAKTDVAVWRPSTGTWYIVQSSNGAVRVVTWGTGGDIPLGGDFDGDGQADIVIWRPSTGDWFVNKSTGGTSILGWGTTGDTPLLGDFDGDKKTDATIFRPSNGVWYIALSGGGTTVKPWGASGDIPVPGDFDGDAKSDITIFRPSSGEWMINKSTGGVTDLYWGTAGDVPVSGDWDGDGTDDLTIWRPNSGVWYTQFANGGAAIVGWGLNGDRPIGRLPGS